MQEKSADCGKNCTFLVESKEGGEPHLRLKIKNLRLKIWRRKPKVKAFLEEAPSVGIIPGKKMDLVTKSNMAFIKKSDDTLALLALFKSA